MVEKNPVIVDEQRIADFLKRGFTYEGFHVDVRYDGETGLKAAHANPPDLVILNVMLPGLDDWEVCRRLCVAIGVLLIQQLRRWL